jgi:ADP-heptose:LPS heptosyltransferase
LKPKLLIVELWHRGDLVIGTPFLRAATERFDVTLVAKPYALDLQPRLWPNVKICPFDAPWTAFKKKYHLWRWPLLEMLRLRRTLVAERFDFGLSARWARLGGDPRDHFLLKIVRAKERIGFPNIGSGILLTQALARPAPDAHRYESWRVAGRALGIELPPRDQLVPSPPRQDKVVLLHTGARRRVRVWPLENYRRLAERLREKGMRVQVACDPNQENWWKQNGETSVITPRTVAELIELVDHAGVLVGNDSGPGHLAAFCGVPTFTIFGPQLPEWFAPLHPQAEWTEGKACPYKPCSDYCRFSRPFCIHDLTGEEVLPRIEQFVRKHIGAKASVAA